MNNISEHDSAPSKNAPLNFLIYLSFYCYICRTSVKFSSFSNYVLENIILCLFSTYVIQKMTFAIQVETDEHINNIFAYTRYTHVLYPQVQIYVSVQVSPQPQIAFTVELVSVTTSEGIYKRARTLI